MPQVNMRSMQGECAYLVKPLVDPDGTVLRNIKLLLNEDEEIAITIEVENIRIDPNAPVDEPQEMEHDVYRIYPYFLNGNNVEPLVILRYYPEQTEVYIAGVHPDLESRGWVTFEYIEG